MQPCLHAQTHTHMIKTTSSRLFPLLFVGMTLLALQGISEMLKCVRGIGEAVSGTDDTKGGDAA